jgi:putative membrane protein
VRRDDARPDRWDTLAVDDNADSAPADDADVPAVGSAPAASAPWWEEGVDPDYRFSLANERTFLAWIRTSLAFIAAAVALEQLVPAFTVHGVRTALSVALAVFGLLAGVGAYRHWMRSERAMRRGEALPRTSLMLWLSIGLAAIAAVIAVVLAVQAT